MSALADQKRLAAESLLSALPVPMEEASWAHDMRARARTRLLDAGAPVRRDEYWRYTDPARLTAPMAIAGDAAEVPSLEDFGPNVPTARFVNGVFRPDLSDPLGGDGMAIAQLGETLKQDITIAREVFGVLETDIQKRLKVQQQGS